jgi:hypothetical protein
MATSYLKSGVRPATKITGLSKTLDSDTKGQSIINLNGELKCSFGYVGIAERKLHQKES